MYPLIFSIMTHSESFKLNKSEPRYAITAQPKFHFSEFLHPFIHQTISPSPANIAPNPSVIIYVRHYDVIGQKIERLTLFLNAHLNFHQNDRQFHWRENDDVRGSNGAPYSHRIVCPIRNDSYANIFKFEINSEIQQCLQISCVQLAWKIPSGRVNIDVTGKTCLQRQ